MPLILMAAAAASFTPAILRRAERENWLTRYDANRLRALNTAQRHTGTAVTSSIVTKALL
jgi:hypothetical protein